jgi:hypothetical protein
MVRRSSSAVSQEIKVVLLARERDEALEQLSAASEVLKVISSSPGDLKPVFQSMMEKATRICGAKLGALYLREAGRFRPAVTYGVELTLEGIILGQLVRPAPNTILDRRRRPSRSDLGTRRKIAPTSSRQ